MASIPSAQNKRCANVPSRFQEPIESGRKLRNIDRSMKSITQLLKSSQFKNRQLKKKNKNVQSAPKTREKKIEPKQTKAELQNIIEKCTPIDVERYFKKNQEVTVSRTSKTKQTFDIYIKECNTSKTDDNLKSCDILTPVILPKNSEATNVSSGLQKSIKKNIIKKNTEFHPNKLKRKVQLKEDWLKPKTKLSKLYHIEGVVRRKMFIPRQDLKALKNNTRRNDQPYYEELGIKEMVRVIEDRGLSDEDFMEILTCPSPVWWEDQEQESSDEFMEDAIPEEIFDREDEKLKLKLLSYQEVKENETVETLKNINITSKDAKFMTKRNKLENLLGNIVKNVKSCSLITNKEEKVSQKVKINTTAVNKNNRTEDVVNIVETNTINDGTINDNSQDEKETVQIDTVNETIEHEKQKVPTNMEVLGTANIAKEESVTYNDGKVGAKIIKMNSECDGIKNADTSKVEVESIEGTVTLKTTDDNILGVNIDDSKGVSKLTKVDVTNDGIENDNTSKQDEKSSKKLLMTDSTNDDIIDLHAENDSVEASRITKMDINNDGIDFKFSNKDKETESVEKTTTVTSNAVIMGLNIDNDSENIAKIRKVNVIENTNTNKQIVGSIEESVMTSTANYEINNLETYNSSQDVVTVTKVDVKNDRIENTNVSKEELKKKTRKEDLKEIFEGILTTNTTNDDIMDVDADNDTEDVAEVIKSNIQNDEIENAHTNNEDEESLEESLKFDDTNDDIMDLDTYESEDAAKIIALVNDCNSKICGSESIEETVKTSTIDNSIIDLNVDEKSEGLVEIIKANITMEKPEYVPPVTKKVDIVDLDVDIENKLDFEIEDVSELNDSTSKNITISTDDDASVKDSLSDEDILKDLEDMEIPVEKNEPVRSSSKNSESADVYLICDDDDECTIEKSENENSNMSGEELESSNQTCFEPFKEAKESSENDTNVNKQLTQSDSDDIINIQQPSNNLNSENDLEKKTNLHGGNVNFVNSLFEQIPKLILTDCMKTSKVSTKCNQNIQNNTLCNSCKTGEDKILNVTNNQSEKVKYCYHCSSIFDTDKCNYCNNSTENSHIVPQCCLDRDL